MRESIDPRRVVATGPRPRPSRHTVHTGTVRGGDLATSDTRCCRGIVEPILIDGAFARIERHALSSSSSRDDDDDGGGDAGGEEDVGVGEEAEIDARECEEDGDRIGEVRERRARELYRDTWHESPGLAKIIGMRIIFSFFLFRRSDGP